MWNGSSGPIVRSNRVMSVRVDTSVGGQPSRFFEHMAKRANTPSDLPPGEVRQRVLAAHRHRMALNDDNRDRFEDLVASLETAD